MDAREWGYVYSILINTSKKTYQGGHNTGYLMNPTRGDGEFRESSVRRQLLCKGAQL